MLLLTATHTLVNDLSVGRISRTLRDVSKRRLISGIRSRVFRANPNFLPNVHAKQPSTTLHDPQACTAVTVFISHIVFWLSMCFINLLRSWRFVSERERRSERSYVAPYIVMTPCVYIWLSWWSRNDTVDWIMMFVCPMKFLIWGCMTRVVSSYARIWVVAICILPLGGVTI